MHSGSLWAGFLIANYEFMSRWSYDVMMNFRTGRLRDTQV